MKKMYAISLLSLIAVNGLHAWSNRRPERFQEPTPPPAPSAAEMNFPYSDNQTFFAEASYLYWRATEDNVDYGIRLSYPINDFFSHDRDIKAKMEKPHLKWNSGVRLGIGSFLPRHEYWDVSLYATYYYNSGRSQSSPQFENNESLNPAWNSTLLGPSFHSTVRTQLNLYSGDLAFGRNFTLSSWAILHPFIGVRGAVITQSYYNRNNSVFPSTITGEFLIFPTRFKAENELYGVGPRIGTDLLFRLGKGWLLQANLSSSFLWAHYEVSEKFNGQTSPLDNERNPLATRIKGRDSGQALRTNVEGFLGIGWETWGRDHTVRFAPSIRFEISQWFAVNQWFDLRNSGSLVPAPTRIGRFGLISKRHYGNLGFRGISINCQADF